MADPFGDLDPSARTRLRRRAQPDWIAPTLAVLIDEPFSDPDWIFERKLDGVRALAFRCGDAVRLRSRNRRSLNAAFPELAEALAAERCRDFVADGEIVAFDGAVTSFAKLQQRIGVRDAATARARGVTVHLYLFDLLHLEGHDLRALALRDRKALLKSALSFPGPVRFTPHRNADGVAFLEQACARGWEGLIAKDARSSYAGRRSLGWRKLKCGRGQELVIGGFTDPQGSRRHFGALLVGHFDAAGALRYAGKVGTGYDRQTLAALGEKLARLERRTSPFADPVREAGVHWVTPKLVGEFGFSEWTRDGKLRHPRFLGLRGDKPAAQVRREQPERRS